MNVLIVAGTPQAVQTLAGSLEGAGCDIRTATDAMTVRAIDLSGFNVIFISVPISGESGVQLISEIRKRSGAHIIALVREDKAADYGKNTAGSGAYIITKPLFKGALLQAVHFCELNLAHERELRERADTLEKRLSEQKVVCRAKLTLIERGMTEEQAHRHIQQTAMNKRITQIEAAEEILSNS